jgi:predicted aspartyl protease
MGTVFRRLVPGVLVAVFLAQQGRAHASEPPPAAPGIAAPEVATRPDEPGEPVYAAPTQDDRIGRVVAPVYVNGQGPFHFVVDTGANRSVISPQLASRLGLEPDPNVPLLLRGITGSQSVPSLAVDSLTIGDVELRNLRLPTVAPGVLAGADGILGVDGFERMCLYVDFVADVVTVTRRGCRKVDSYWAQSARGKLLANRLLAVRARIGRTPVRAIVDTGAERSLGNLALFRALQLKGIEGVPITAAEVLGATEHRADGLLLNTPDLILGEITVGSMQVTFGDFAVFELWELEDEPAVVLGMDVLGTAHALMIDYRRAQFSVLPIGALDAPPQVRPMGIPTRIP